MVLPQVSEVNIAKNDDIQSEPAATVSQAPSETATTSSEEKEEEFTAADASLLQKIIRKGLVESKNDIEVQRKDPNSPLYSVKTFEALHL